MPVRHGKAANDFRVAQRQTTVKYLPANNDRFAKSNAFWLGSTLLLAVIIGVLTLANPVQMTPISPGNDKVYHLLAFASLVFPTALLRPRMLLAVATLALIYGGVIELVQPTVGRTAEYGDMLANALGVGLGILVGLAVQRLVRGPK